MQQCAEWAVLEQEESFQPLACLAGGSVELREPAAHTAALHDGWDVPVHVSLPCDSHRRIPQGKPCWSS